MSPATLRTASGQAVEQRTARFVKAVEDAAELGIVDRRQGLEDDLMPRTGAPVAWRCDDTITCPSTREWRW